MQTFRGRLSAALHGALSSSDTRRFLRKGSWGFADQATISATNFATMVLVARVVSPGEFGLYSLAYTGLLFTNSIQSALIVQPHAVLGARRSGADYVAYTTDTGWFQLGVAMMTALLALGMALVATALDWWVAPILFALIPATVAWQFQDFIRRAMYTRSNFRAAFLNDLVSYGGQLLTLIVLERAGALTPVSAILALAATSALGVLIGFWQIRAQLDWRFDRTRMRANVRTNWDFGKWLVGGSIAYWTASQIYPILAAGLVSVTATGVMRAASTIIGPTHIFMTAIDPLFGPKASRMYAKGGLPALRTLLARIEFLVFIAMGLYCGAVAIFAEPLLRLLYGPGYSQYSWMLVVVALTNLARAVRSPVKIGLKALGETSAIFRIYAIAGALNLTLGLAVVHLFGFKGVALGMILNAAVLQALMWHVHHKYMGGPIPIIPMLARRAAVAPEHPG